MNTAPLKRRVEAAAQKLASAGGGPPIIEVWTDHDFFEGGPADPNEPDERPRLLGRVRSGRWLEWHGWDGIDPVASNE